MLLDRPELKAQQDLQVRLDRRELLGLPEQQELKARLDQPELKVLLDPQVQLDRRELPV